MDAITLEVMRNRFFAITEEMGAALIRTAYSTNIKDRRDCSCALFDVNGETIAQAEHIPVHSGVLPWGVKGALKHINKKELKLEMLSCTMIHSLVELICQILLSFLRSFLKES